MGIKIKFKNIILLDCSNAIFCGFYNQLINFIEENNLILNNNLMEFIENLEAGCRGIGLDIANYLTEKDDILIFTQIIRKSLDNLYQETPHLPTSYKNLYEEFYSNIMISINPKK